MHFTLKILKIRPTFTSFLYLKKYIFNVSLLFIHVYTFNNTYLRVYILNITFLIINIEVSSAHV